nr:beta-ketoacyl-[acyl-carrier-protein] synthase family protein [Rhodococcus sp. (in: high G+C Gram-positive bacteria)]
MTARRVVVTGFEVIAPGGIGVSAFWDLLTSGRTATRRVRSFDPSPFRSQIAAEVAFDPEAFGVSSRQRARTGRAGQFALATAMGAVRRSGLDVAEVDLQRVGVTIGSAVGATVEIETDYRVVSDDGRLDVVDPALSTPHFYEHFVPSSFAREVATATGAGGPCSVVSTGCTSGIDAVGQAARQIADGTVDVMIAGGTDAPISPISVACFDAIRATSNRNDDPETASRPFDASRNGFVLGEGAAMFVLEEREAALGRGATVYGEVLGYATRCNAYHMTGLRSDGTEMSSAIDDVMGQSGIGTAEVDYINAHGSGTKQNDLHETAAFKQSLGTRSYEIPVSSIKSMIGHSLGAIGAIEIAACLLTMSTSTVPPTANLHNPGDGCDLDYVPLTARGVPVRNALTVGSGFGGFQSAMALGRGEKGVAA